MRNLAPPGAPGTATGVGIIVQEPSVLGARRGRPLVVLHLMKTGGFSLLHQIMANVEREAVWGAPGPEAGDELQLEHYTSVELLRALDVDERSSIQVVVGHLPFVVVDLAGFGGATIATVVREPVGRITSFLAMCIAGHPEHRDHSIEQVYEDEFLQPRLIGNHQTKMLGMTAAQATTPPPRPCGPPNPAIVEALIAEGYFDTTRYVLEVLDTPLVWPVAVDGSTLAQAQRNLERVDVLGLHDRYDDFLARLGGCTGWTIDRTIRANRSPSVAVSSSFRRRIEQDNALDAELYEHARLLVGRS